MQIFCALPNGLVIHNGEPEHTVTLEFGVNTVDDAIGAAWFAANPTSSLVHDMVIYEVVSPAEPPATPTTEEPT